MLKQRPFLVEVLTAIGADRGAVRAALSRLHAEHDQPHPDLGPVRPRLRYPVRLHRAAVVRPVGVLRHRRHVRRLSADRDELPLCACSRSSSAPIVAGVVGYLDRPDRAAAHRHLFRDDHGGDRGSVLLRRVQSAVGLHRRRERPAGRAEAELYLGFTTLTLQHRLDDLCLPRVLVLRRPRHRAAHRALAGRRDPVARSATIRCAPPRSATTSTATSSPPSSSPPPMPASPAACSA